MAIFRIRLDDRIFTGDALLIECWAERIFKTGIYRYPLPGP